MTGHLPEVSLLEAALEGEATPSLHPEVRAHLGSCPACQGRLRAMRDELAHLGTAAAPTAPPPSLRAHILAAVEPGGGQPFAGLARRFARLFDLDGERSRQVLDDARGDTAWAWTGDVSFFHFLPGPALEATAEAGMIRLAPGAVFPRHQHLGDEYGLVLGGTLREDESGREAYPGDIVHMTKDSEHTVTCISRGACTFAVLLHGGFPIIDLG